MATRVIMRGSARKGEGDLLNIDYYREFIELGRCLNYTQAAEKLHITQPALSKHIVALEREYGADLFIRDRRAVQLTEAGRILFGAAMTIVDTHDRAQSAIETVVKEQPIRVDGVLYDSTISSIITLSSVLLSEQRYAPILFEHHEDRPLLELLEHDEVDMVFSYDEQQVLRDRGFAFKSLVKVRFVAALDADHPLANRESLHMEDLQKETFIQFIDEYSISGWRRIEEVCRTHGFNPKTRPMLGRAVTSYAVTPPSGGVLILQKDLRQLKFLGDVGHTVIVPIVDDDAYFIICCIYKQENHERLAPLVNALEESRDIIMRHHQSDKPDVRT